MKNLFGTHFHRQALFAGLVSLMSIAWCCLFPQPALATTSEELYAQAEEIMTEIDTLQTSINEELQKYDAALEEHEKASEAARIAEERIAEEQNRLDVFQSELSLIMINMYKTGGSKSFLNVALGADTFEDFLTQWDSMSAYSDQGADLVRDAKAAKAAQEAAKKDYDNQINIAAKKMKEADQAQKAISEKQESLRKEAEKITEEAAELQAQEELVREAARQAAIAAQAAEASRREASNLDAEEELVLEYDSGQSIETVHGVLGHPLPEGVFSSGFGYRDLDGGTFHKGLDLAAPEGTTYYAAAYGTVVYTSNSGAYNGGAGNWIVITHGDGLVTKYMHSSKVFVKPGDVVKRGQAIGAVGNTGHSYGPHLHFQVEYMGVAIDPLALL